MTPQQIDAMKMALEALKTSMYPQQKQLQAIASLEETLAEHAMRETQRLGQEIEQEPREDWNSTAWVFADETLEAFAKLVAEKEREACAKILDANAMACHTPIMRSLLQANATAIRSRGEQA